MFWHTGTPERILMKRDIQRRDAWRTTSVANVEASDLSSSSSYSFPIFPLLIFSFSHFLCTDFRTTLRALAARLAFFAKEIADVRSTYYQILSTGHERPPSIKKSSEIF